MKKAVIEAGGKQYIVSEKETIDIDFIKNAGKTIELPVLILLDEGKTQIGKPHIKDLIVTAEVVEPEVKSEKVIAIRYKPKKRVHKVRGHRQRLTKILIKKIGK